MKGRVDTERVLTLIGGARNAIGELKRYNGITENEILSSQDRLGNIKYQWVILIEACIDICNHFSARLYGKAPESYAGCFRILHEVNVIDKSLSDQMAELARFRNVLVHLYWEVDNRRVVQHTKSRLDIVERYLKELGARVQ